MRKKIKMSSRFNKLYYWFTGHPNRINYWSCSKFADIIAKWFRVTEKPRAASFEDWSTWHKSASASSKIGYYITETLLNKIQNILYFPADVADNIHAYYHNRYIDKIHILQTKLPKGKWHDVDTRILHGLFETLVLFVDEEKGMRHKWNPEHTDSKDMTNSQCGIKYLEWEISLGEESPNQAKSASEILYLYSWWKDRDNRADSYTLSGMSTYNDLNRRENEDDSDIMALFNTPRTDEYRALSDKMQSIDDSYDKEDEDNLIKLIKLRGALWT